MRSPRILFDGSPAVDIKKTGVGYYVAHLVDAMARTEKNNIHITGYFFNFLGFNKNDIPHITDVDFYKIWLVPGKALSVLRRLGIQPPLELFTWKPSDIVFYTNYVALPLLRKRRMALAIYDLGFLDHPEYIQSVNLTYLKRFCPPSIKRADVIITISEFTKERILHWFPDIKADIVVTPIPPAPLQRINAQLSERLTRLGVRPQKYLLYLGTIEPRKNIQALVQAYAKLDPELRKEYALVLAGGKGWKDEAIWTEITKQRKNGMNIITTGYVSDDEKEALYTSCTGFVLPSHYEGFGMPVLEAMRYEVPVAVSDISVFHEVADDAALYFDKDNVQAIANSLHALLADSALRDRLVNKGKTQLQKFDWQTNAKLVLDAFESALK